MGLADVKVGGLFGERSKDSGDNNYVLEAL